METHTEPGPFAEWAVIDLFGHVQLAGRVTEAQIGGCSFLRVDVPATAEWPAFTRFLGQGAIYSMTIVAKEVVYEVLKTLRPRPVERFMLPEVPGASRQPLLDYGDYAEDDS